MIAGINCGLRPVRALPRPVPLAALQDDARLSQLALLRQSRLSVVPVRAAEFDAVLELAQRGSAPR